MRWWLGAVMAAARLLSPAAVAQNGAGEARLNADLDDSVWDATVSTKNRDRFLEAKVAKEFLARVGVPQLRLSNRHRRAGRADIYTSPIAQQNLIGRMWFRRFTRLMPHSLTWRGQRARLLATLFASSCR